MNAGANLALTFLLSFHCSYHFPPHNPTHTFETINAVINFINFKKFFLRKFFSELRQKNPCIIIHRLQSIKAFFSKHRIKNSRLTNSSRTSKGLYFSHTHTTIISAPNFLTTKSMHIIFHESSCIKNIYKTLAMNAY